MYCTNCGNKVEKDQQKFCDECGYDLRKPREERPKQPSSTQPTTPQPASQTQPITQPAPQQPISPQTTYQAPTQVPAQQVPQQPTNFCPTCRQPLSYSKEMGQMYCYACNRSPYQSTQNQPIQTQPTQTQLTQGQPTQGLTTGHQTSWHFYNLTIPVQQVVGHVQNWFNRHGYTCKCDASPNSMVLNIEKGTALWKGKVKLHFQGNQSQMNVTLDRGSKGMAFLKGGLLAKQMQDDIQRISENIPHIIDQYSRK
jgi:hypothetical protein